MENLGLSTPNNFNNTAKGDMKINAFQTTSEFYNPNKNTSKNGKQTASLPIRVRPVKKANYVSDNDLSMEMDINIINDEEFENNRLLIECDPKIMKITKKPPKLE